MTFTVTIPLWLPIAYLLTGLVLWLPLEYLAWRNIQVSDRGSFWSGFRERLPRRPWVPLAIVLVWPLAVWEHIR